MVGYFVFQGKIHVLVSYFISSVIKTNDDGLPSKRGAKITPTDSMAQVSYPSKHDNPLTFI